MTTFYDVPAGILTPALAEKLASVDQISMPEWGAYVKTGVHREKPPSQENWWQTQSELCGVPDGVSYGLDKGRVGRIKGLGNAIVPQIAWFIGNAIVSAQNIQVAKRFKKS
jgi:hypothetical protein